MSRSALRVIIVLGVVSIVGIIITQIYWITRAYSEKEEHFHRQVKAALEVTADKILPAGMTQQIVEPVQRISSNYYVVEIDHLVDPVALEYVLKTQLNGHDVHTDFEYGIYDCGVDSMMYGRYVHFDDTTFIGRVNLGSLPAFTWDKNYFGVYFPLKERYLLKQMGFWVFSSVILLLVTVFLGYAIFVLMKQRRLSEIRRDFINNMTHEFKTPISTISLSTEVLLKPETVADADRVRKYAGIIRKENLRMQQQVEKVLQAATLDKDDLRVNREPLDLHAMIQDAITTVKAALAEREGNISLKLEASDSLIRADKVHLSNIIYNLLDNAIKYCKERPEILVSTRNAKQGVILSVKDNGIGISKEAQRHVFTKFYRVPTGNVHDVKGFGLGLSYVKLMVEAHGGTITLKSEPGVGSTFEIYLPQYN
jgi:two-component system phosphate regulon sensor histidine kinase PhoR